MKKRILVVLLALVCAFSGCAQSGVPAQSSGSDEIVLNVSVEDTADDISKEAVRRFTRKLNELGSGRFNINVFYEKNPYESFLAGEADIIVCSDDLLSVYYPGFEVFGSPFFFKNIEHASMTLNSSGFDTYASANFRASGARMLAAVYRDSSVIISREEYMYEVDDFAGKSIAEPDDYRLGEVFRALGSVVLSPDSDRAAESADGTDLTEVRLEEWSSAYISGPELQETLYLLETFHLMRTEWMIISEEFWQKLESGERAYIKEATAYYIAGSEEPRIESYKEFVKKFTAAGGKIINYDKEELRKAVRDTVLKGGYIPESDREFYDGVYNILR